MRGEATMGKLGKEIRAMADAMRDRLTEAVLEGRHAAEGQFTLGEHEVCVSIDATGCDVEVYGEGGAEGLPNVEDAVRRAMPTVAEVCGLLEEADADRADEEELHRRLEEQFLW